VERELLVESAYRVQTQNFWYSPAMPGNWDSPTAKFDPNIHTPYINVRPTDLLRMMLGKVIAKVLGVKENNDIARIGKVINGKTGEADNTAVRNEYVIIECNRSKVYPDDDNTLGVYFVNSAGQRFRVSERLLHNTSKMVTPKVPADIEPGEYGLEIVTRFSSGKQMLKEPRTIIYDSKLSIS
jgi:hypothetical protein